ncbi:MAG: DUF1800 domain-containing protein [Gammaproteobacteria bacterium]
MISSATVIAANRFGLGARPGELERIGATHREWLLAQIAPADAPAEIGALSGSKEILTEFDRLRRERRINRDRLEAGDVNAEDLKKFAQGMGALLRPHYIDQVGVRYRISVTTDAPFRERLVHFWANHFAVSVDKPPVTGLAGTLENEAVRPHVAGYFADMLLAVERHPAIILYLDNQASIGPNSRAANFMRRRGRGAGRVIDINENLGREILELHTLGVDAGYTQDDVTTFSKVITGWSIGGKPGGGRRGNVAADAATGEFAFRDAIHEPGAKTILGKTYADDGVGQGEAVMRDLAVHPATARHIATKLARHFIADDPDDDAVERIAAAYLDGDGYLPDAYAALIDAGLSRADHVATKFKTPEDFMVSAIRGLGIVPERSRQYVSSLTLMGQPPYKPGSPAGWPDTTADWDGADALMKRIEWAQALGQRAGPAFEPLDVAIDCLGPALGAHSKIAVRRAESKPQGLAMLMMSPEFQRR